MDGNLGWPTVLVGPLFLIGALGRHRSEPRMSKIALKRILVRFSSVGPGGTPCALRYSPGFGRTSLRYPVCVDAYWQVLDVIWSWALPIGSHGSACVFVCVDTCV